jgi:hypothetical protein
MTSYPTAREGCMLIQMPACSCASCRKRLSVKFSKQTYRNPFIELQTRRGQIEKGTACVQTKQSCCGEHHVVQGQYIVNDNCIESSVSGSCCYMQAGDACSPKTSAGSCIACSEVPHLPPHFAHQPHCPLHCVATAVGAVRCSAPVAVGQASLGSLLGLQVVMRELRHQGCSGGRLSAGDAAIERSSEGCLNSSDVLLGRPGLAGADLPSCWRRCGGERAKN